MSAVKDCSLHSSLVHLDYEIHGQVQGVFFRKYTKSKAMELRLNGWVMNTRQGTVKGVVEGPRSAIDEMKVWLSTKGSPSSRISRFNFEEKIIVPSEKEFRDFRIVK